jgi:hypothetical protein
MNPSEMARDGKDPPSVADHLPEKRDGTDSALVDTDAVPGPLDAREEARTNRAGNSLTLPPGQHPYDPVNKDLDPVGFALYRVQTFLVWIEEHRATFEKYRHSDQEFAEGELGYLRDSTLQGMIYLRRLSELLLAGHTIDPNKRLPESLRRGWFCSYLDQMHVAGPEFQEGEKEAGGKKRTGRSRRKTRGKTGT